MEISDQLQRLLLSEKKRYPLAEIQDYYKVVFQSIFGAGHLIKDPTAAIQYLTEEWNNVKESYTDDLLIDISLNISMVRLNLSRAKAENLSLKEIANAFLEGSQSFSNPLQVNFAEVLCQVASILTSECFGFCRKEIEQKLPLHVKTDFPIMHHSLNYRTLYHPWYRVIPGEKLMRKWSDTFPYKY